MRESKRAKKMKDKNNDYKLKYLTYQRNISWIPPSWYLQCFKMDDVRLAFASRLVCVCGYIFIFLLFCNLTFNVQHTYIYI